MRYRSVIASLALFPLLVVGACDEGPTISPITPDDPDPLPVAPRSSFSMQRGTEGYPTTGEIRSGFVVGPDGTPMEVTYEIHDGLAIWQGDIVIGEAGEIPTTPEELLAYPDPPNGLLVGARGVTIDGAGFRWPGGVIPYTITDATTSIVNAAIQIIEDQTPGVTLRPFVAGDANWVTFQDASGCSSAIGMQGGQQFINLKVDDGTSLCSVGNAAHEILHALGMYHEHTRCDRDGFVTIDYAEIEAGREGNFWKAGAAAQNDACGTGNAVSDDGAYDYGSMMHYGPNAFAIGDNPTITATQPGGGAMGQRSAVGPTDQATIDLLYGANNAAPVAIVAALAASYPEGTPVPFDASGSTDADDDESILTYAWTFGDGTCPGPLACSDDDPDHPYIDDGVYGWGVTVSDGFDAGAAGANITITNVAPSVGVGADAVINEGDLFARAGSFTDPGADTWTATVDYDDGPGAVSLTLTGKTFSLSNTYVDNRATPYNVEVVVTDDDGGIGSDDADVTVNNVAPSVDAGADATVTSGDTYDFSGSFSDPGIVDDPWDWVIDWDDGTPNTTGSTSDQSAPILASHQFCAAGDRMVSLTVTDKDLGVGSDDLTIMVPYVVVPISIKPNSSPNPVNLNAGGVIPVAILSTAAFDALDVDPSTVVLGDEVGADTPVNQRNNGTYQTLADDVDGDGLTDLVLYFKTQDLVGNGDLTEFSTELVLRGFLDDGCTNVRGVGPVVVRPS